MKSGKWSFAQLFVNDQRRFRPRLPKHGYYTIERELPPTETAGRKWTDRFGYSGDDLRPDWANRGDVEVVAFCAWSATRLAHCRDRSGRAHRRRWPASPRWPTIGAFPKGERFLVENVREALGEPGQWYLDRPQRRVDLRSACRASGRRRATVIAPRLERLLVIEGDPKARRWVEHLRFRGLTFAHANWTMPARGPDLRPGGSEPRRGRVGRSAGGTW